MKTAKKTHSDKSLIPKSIKNYFSNIKKCAVAFSGGTDSSLVVKIASDILGEKNVIAVTGVSETYPAEDLKTAVSLTKTLGVKHFLIYTQELKDKNFVRNLTDRCHFCKSELFGKIKSIANKNGTDTIIDGSNYDDRADYRPGMAAARCFGVRSPLLELRIGKGAVRKLSQALGLFTWDKPQSPCLASRVPYGTRITTRVIKKVAGAEKIIKKLVNGNIRVRYYGDIARIEVDKKNTGLLIKKLTPEITKKIKALGFKYVTIDVDGFRSGNLNK